MKKAQEGVQAALEQLQGEVDAERAGNKEAFAKLGAAAEAEELARRAAERKLAEAEGKLAAAEAAAEQLQKQSDAELRRLQEQKRAAEARISALQTRLEGMQVLSRPRFWLGPEQWLFIPMALSPALLQ